MTKLNKLLITASTFPASDTDHAPAFVKDQAIWLKNQYPHLHIDILAPHNSHTITRDYTKYEHYDEYRFHYAWPFTNWEKLAGRSIMPAIRKNPLMLLLVPFLFIAETYATYRLIKKNDYDLIYAHWFTPQAITATIACKLTNKPFVFTSHSGDIIILEKVPFGRLITKWVCDQALGYTVVSQQTADKLLSMTPEDKIYQEKMTIIPMGTNIPDKTFPPSTTGSHFKLFFIGRLVSIKGVDYLLRALADLKDDYTFALDIAGDGQQRDDLEKLTTTLGLNDKVKFVGYASGQQKDDLFSQADIIVIPSVREGKNTEGLPVTLMESLAAGKIVIASDVTGAQEYLTNGKDGYLFEQRNISELKSALKKVFEMDKPAVDAMSQSARKLSKVFDWPVIAKKHYELFEEVLDVKKNSTDQ